MSTPWSMTTIVCDDVRKEEGNKLSYMGVYGSNIVVPSFPIALAKLCFAMSLRAPGCLQLPKSLTFHVLRDEDVLAEVSLLPESLVAAGALAEGHRDKDPRRLDLGTVIQLFPLQFHAPCVLSARAICDGKEIKGGSWPIERGEQ